MEETGGEADFTTNRYWMLVHEPPLPNLNKFKNMTKHLNPIMVLYFIRMLLLQKRVRGGIQRISDFMKTIAC